MKAETLNKIGFALCVVGLAIALLSLVPAIVPDGELPWPVFVGSMVYLPGSFLVFFTSKGKDRATQVNKVRLVRIGFFAVIALMSLKVLSS